MVVLIFMNIDYLNNHLPEISYSPQEILVCGGIPVEVNAYGAENYFGRQILLYLLIQEAQLKFQLYHQLHTHLKELIQLDVQVQFCSNYCS